MNTLSAVITVLAVSNITLLWINYANTNKNKGLKNIICELMASKAMLELRDTIAKRYISNLESRLAEYEPDAYDKNEIKLPPCMQDMPSKRSCKN